MSISSIPSISSIAATLAAFAVALAVCEPATAQEQDSAAANATAYPPLRSVAPPSAELKERLNLSDFYAKWVDADGFPILGSEKVSDYALLEAAWIVDHMLAGRDDIRRALVESKTRCVVMAASEMTTAVPEHSDLEPARYWDRRARGLGATRRRPVISCGEENLLGLRGDPYSAENILVHEFAHTMHQMGVNRIDRSFDRKLRDVYRQAIDEGLWRGTYAATNAGEYWAEGVQSWFDTNRSNDGQHNHVDTREELKEYDPRLAALCAEVYGENEWRYQRPRDRGEKAHLDGFDSRESGLAFRWPDGLNEWYREYNEQRRRERQP